MKKFVPVAALAIAAVALAGCSGSTAPGAGAEEGPAFPESGKPVTLVVPFDAGGITDVFARLFAPALEEALGTTVRVENKPGAGGQIGQTYLVVQEADGYTIGFTNLPSTLAYLDPERGATYDYDSFTPIGGVGLSPTVIAVKGDSSYDTLEDLVEAAEGDPGALTVGSGGSGASDDYLATVGLEDAADIDLNIVTFEGGSADKITALLGGNVEAVVGSVGGFLGQVASGDIRLLASATEERSALTEDVPTFTEAGYDVVSSGTLNISGPAGIPEDVVEAISAAIKKATESQEFIDKSATSGFEVLYSTSDDLATLWTEQEDAIAPLFE